MLSIWFTNYFKVNNIVRKKETDVIKGILLAPNITEIQKFKLFVSSISIIHQYFKIYLKYHRRVRKFVTENQSVLIVFLLHVITQCDSKILC